MGRVLSGLNVNRDGHAVILFDGVCNLCNAWVNFVIERDPEGRFRFASLQSEAGRRLLAAHGLPEGYLGGLVLVEEGEGGGVYTGSEAAVRIARGLRGGWKALSVLRFVPRRARDAVYAWVARNRYRWFGKRETCRVPTEAERGRFL